MIDLMSAEEFKKKVMEKIETPNQKAIDDILTGLKDEIERYIKNANPSKWRGINVSINVTNNRDIDIAKAREIIEAKGYPCEIGASPNGQYMHINFEWDHFSDD